MTTKQLLILLRAEIKRHGFGDSLSARERAARCIRWSSVSEDYTGQPCNASGCGCGGKVMFKGVTLSRDESANWFRRVKE